MDHLAHSIRDMSMARWRPFGTAAGDVEGSHRTTLGPWLRDVAEAKRPPHSMAALTPIKVNGRPSLPHFGRYNSGGVRTPRAEPLRSRKCQGNSLSAFPAYTCLP